MLSPDCNEMDIRHEACLTCITSIKRIGFVVNDDRHGRARSGATRMRLTNTPSFGTPLDQHRALYQR
jgi:hypothetical protein